MLTTDIKLMAMTGDIVLEVWICVQCANALFVLIVVASVWAET